jgi:peroxiredoxin
MAVVAVAIAVGTMLLDAKAGFTSVTLTGDTSGPRPTVGQAPPDFTATTTDGKAFSLAALKGQPVWLTFGATWCGDCRAEAPDLQATAAKYRSTGLVVVGVFLQENASNITAYAKRVGMDFTFIPDPSTILASRYRVMGLPTHIFIGRDGLIREMRLGGLPPEEMDRLAQSILR